MKRLFIVVCLAMAITTPVLADVTITSTMGGKGMGQMMSGQVLTYIKGLKMRTEMTIMGRPMVTIMDAETGKTVRLDAEKKEATVVDMGMTTAAAQKALAAPPKVSLTANGQTKVLLGQSCSGFDLSSSMTVNMGQLAQGNPNAQGMEMTFTMSGPLWVAKDAPGAADYAVFYKAQAAKGLAMMSAPSARPDPGQAAVMAEMYKKMAEMNGIPYAMEFNIKFQGTGPMAQMMSGMGDTSMTTTVTAVAVTPLADALFAVPAGYTMKTR